MSDLKLTKAMTKRAEVVNGRVIKAIEKIVAKRNCEVMFGEEFRPVYYSDAGNALQANSEIVDEDGLTIQIQVLAFRQDV